MTVDLTDIALSAVTDPAKIATYRKMLGKNPERLAEFNDLLKLAAELQGCPPPDELPPLETDPALAVLAAAANVANTATVRDNDGDANNGRHEGKQGVSAEIFGIGKKARRKQEGGATRPHKSIGMEKGTIAAMPYGWDSSARKIKINRKTFRPKPGEPEYQIVDVPQNLHPDTLDILNRHLVKTYRTNDDSADRANVETVRFAQIRPDGNGGYTIVPGTESEFLLSMNDASTPQLEGQLKAELVIQDHTGRGVLTMASPSCYPKAQVFKTDKPVV